MYMITISKPILSLSIFKDDINVKTLWKSTPNVKQYFTDYNNQKLKKFVSFTKKKYSN